MKLLIVEDDRDTAAALAASPIARKFTIDTASEGQSALELAEMTEYDLIVLDVMLPGVDGISLCRQLRAHDRQEPILLLAAKDNFAARMAGFEAGADDCVTKPYELSELLARIRALLRRTNKALTEILCWGSALQLDPNNCEVTCFGKSVHLTPKEYKLLEVFLRHPRRVFDRRTLLDLVWAIDECPGEEAVTTQIRGLRRKLKSAGLVPDPVETLYGLGYRLRPLTEEDGKTKLYCQSPSAINPETKAVEAIGQMWREYRERLQGQLAKVEEAIARLSLKTFTSDERQQVRALVHWLIGSLEAFGIPRAAALGRQLERTLTASSAAVRAQELTRLESLLKQLWQSRTSSEN